MTTNPALRRAPHLATIAQATIADNIVYNIPRAAINFNDGFGGGAEIRRASHTCTPVASRPHTAADPLKALPICLVIGDVLSSTLACQGRLTPPHEPIIIINVMNIIISARDA